jgi:hypothetical protein
MLLIAGVAVALWRWLSDWLSDWLGWIPLFKVDGTQPGDPPAAGSRCGAGGARCRTGTSSPRPCRRPARSIH